MGPKRGFVPVANVHVPYWSSKIPAHAAGVKGPGSVPPPDQHSCLRLKHEAEKAGRMLE